MWDMSVRGMGVCGVSVRLCGCRMCACGVCGMNVMMCRCGVEL